MKKRNSYYVTIILVMVLIAVIAVNIFLYYSANIENKDMNKQIQEAKKTNETIPEYSIDLSDYESVNVSIMLTNIRLVSNCHMISFDVTVDQAYSIFNALEKQPSERPLTHDIFIDALEDFDINILAGMIDEYRNGIYLAKIYLRQENKILQLDARPSDTIALLARLGMPLYVKKGVLQNSTYIC